MLCNKNRLSLSLNSRAYPNDYGGVVRGFAYQFSAAGMITNVTRENGEQAAFTYDDLDRLTGEQWINATGDVTHCASYQYDLVGNRIQAVVNGVSVAYTIGAGNKLGSWVTSGLQQFDAAGNVISLQHQYGRQMTMTWDSRYRLTAAATNGMIVESYAYDALGRRISIGSAAGTNYLIYDGPHVVAETT